VVQKRQKGTVLSIFIVITFLGTFFKHFHFQAFGKAFWTQLVDIEY